MHMIIGRVWQLEQRSSQDPQGLLRSMEHCALGPLGQRLSLNPEPDRQATQVQSYGTNSLRLDRQTWCSITHHLERPFPHQSEDTKQMHQHALPPGASVELLQQEIPGR